MRYCESSAPRSPRKNTHVQALEGNFGKDPAWVDPDDNAPKKKQKKQKPSTAKQVWPPM